MLLHIRILLVTFVRERPSWTADSVASHRNDLRTSIAIRVVSIDIALVAEATLAWVLIASCSDWRKTWTESPPFSNESRCKATLTVVGTPHEHLGIIVQRGRTENWLLVPRFRNWQSTNRRVALFHREGSSIVQVRISFDICYATVSLWFSPSFAIADLVLVSKWPLEPSCLPFLFDQDIWISIPYTWTVLDLNWSLLKCSWELNRWCWNIWILINFTEDVLSVISDIEPLRTLAQSKHAKLWPVVLLRFASDVVWLYCFLHADDLQRVEVLLVFFQRAEHVASYGVSLVTRNCLRSLVIGNVVRVEAHVLRVWVPLCFVLKWHISQFEDVSCTVVGTCCLEVFDLELLQL